jgi:hypothetical protein
MEIVKYRLYMFIKVQYLRRGLNASLDRREILLLAKL